MTSITDTVQCCNDMSSIRPFYLPKNLYLKPVATINISIQLPILKSEIPQAISNKTIMQNIISLAAPDIFCSLKMTKCTIEFLRFEGEIQNIEQRDNVLNRLNGKTIKLSGFKYNLKIKAVVSKPDFPTRHDWDSFFRDAKNMNEMKAGERPDTLHITNIPRKWFSKISSDTPNETTIRKAFGNFGEITEIDIPSNDPYRSQMKSSISGVTLFGKHTEDLFEVYIQYKDYIGFVKAMDSLRGMKLFLKDGTKGFTANVKVNFDKSKHLSLSSTHRRNVARETLKSKERDEENKRRLQEEEEKRKQAKSKEKAEANKRKTERRINREEKRKTRELKKIRLAQVNYIDKKIASEEKLLLIAQRKLESIRLLTILLQRIKNKKELQMKKEKCKAFKSPQSSSNEEDDVETKSEDDSKIKSNYNNNNNSFNSRLKSAVEVRKNLNEYPNKNYQTSFSGYNRNFRGSFRNRGRFQRRNWNHNRYNNWNQNFPSSSLCVPQEIWMKATQDMCYRYLKSIARLSRSRSRSRRSSSSRSRSRSRSRNRSRNYRRHSRTRSKSKEKFNRDDTKSKSNQKSSSKSEWSPDSHKSDLSWSSEINKS